MGKVGCRVDYNPIHDPDRDPNYEPGWYCDFPTRTCDITF